MTHRQDENHALRFVRISRELSYIGSKMENADNTFAFQIHKRCVCVCDDCRERARSSINERKKESRKKINPLVRHMLLLLVIEIKFVSMALWKPSK